MHVKDLQFTSVVTLPWHTTLTTFKSALNTFQDDIQAQNVMLNLQ